MSATGLCLECGRRRRRENAEQLVAHRGPYFDRWRQRCLAALGVPALDDPSSGA